MYADLALFRDALALISGVSTCKIGLEVGICPDDYPLVRIVPVRITPGKPYSGRTAECLIYFGQQIGQADSGGLEAVYESLSTLEAAILVEVKALGGRYRETIADEDKLDTYKLMAIRCELPVSAAVPVP